VFLFWRWSLAMSSIIKHEHSFIDKWNWKMDYCLKNRWPPSNSYFWAKAEDAYFKQINI